MTLVFVSLYATTVAQNYTAQGVGRGRAIQLLISTRPYVYAFALAWNLG